HD
ncbi:hypothetical protein BN1708_019736, partial [Verticillium longisporum]